MKYKNVETIIRALALLPDFHLVMCSKIDAGRRAELMKSAPPEVVERGQITWKNGVSDAEYRRLLRTAWASVHASKSEGFNLQIVEAQSAGTPLVLSDLPVHHEIAGAAALFFPPDDAEILAQQILKLANPKLRTSLIKKGRDQIKKFSWQTSAEKLDEIIRQT
jgi:glycosyltransferase involved in cell wall biosynthesis